MQLNVRNVERMKKATVLVLKNVNHVELEKDQTQAALNAPIAIVERMGRVAKNVL